MSNVITAIICVLIFILLQYLRNKKEAEIVHNILDSLPGMSTGKKALEERLDELKALLDKELRRSEEVSDILHAVADAALAPSDLPKDRESLLAYLRTMVPVRMLKREVQESENAIWAEVAGRLGMSGDLTVQDITAELDRCGMENGTARDGFLAEVYAIIALNDGSMDPSAVMTWQELSNYLPEAVWSYRLVNRICGGLNNRGIPWRQNGVTHRTEVEDAIFHALNALSRQQEGDNNGKAIQVT